MGFKHGTTNGYTNHGCRCDLCRTCMSKVNKSKSLARKGYVPTECQACGDSANVQWDHDHDTLEHRGWLCRNCNRALGMFQDDLGRMQSAIRYLGAS